MNETVQKPKCIGFIMDGNRRWAKEHKLDLLKGHLKGREVFHEIVRYLRDVGIPHGIFYAFSTENWKRPEREVKYLTNLLQRELKKLLRGVEEEKVRVRFVGERSRFSKELNILMKELEEKSAQYTKTTVWIALSYGGRAEIVQAVNQLVQSGTRVTEESFNDFLWTEDMPAPDLIIRTGGEKRLSNFLPWQSVYSELSFLNVHWPAFTSDMLAKVVEDYSRRTRNFGR